MSRNTVSLSISFFDRANSSEISNEMSRKINWRLCIPFVAIFALAACVSEKPAITHTPSASETPCLGLIATSASTPASWGYGAEYWDEIAISRIAVQNLACASSNQIVKELVLQWLEIIKTSAKRQNCGLEEYTLDTITLMENKITPQYDIVARVNYHVKPGKFKECGWISDRGILEQDGWINTSDTFGVYRENGYFRLIVLPGWGT